MKATPAVGAFGAHFANLMRRLRLAVDTVGGNSQRLQFICSSATIGNPQEMALRFSGRTHHPERLHLISRSGAPSAGRTLLSLAPNSAANVEACKIVISWLQHNLSGIVFCNSRAAVKGLLGLIQRESQRQGLSYLASKVAIFYSSLTSERRREIIQKLQTGKIKVIIATSSLEAGIDLPELDCCLIRGFPGSLMSFWQRVGRAGRKKHGLVIYLPLGQNLIDVFYAQHPEQLLSSEMECAAFNPDYPTILGKHLECGCIESSLDLGELNSITFSYFVCSRSTYVWFADGNDTTIKCFVNKSNPHQWQVELGTLRIKFVTLNLYPYPIFIYSRSSWYLCSYN